MANVTYDPILEVQELRRFRVFTPLSPPRHGTALVLEPEVGEPLLITAGTRVPDARLGHYKRSSLVDLGQHGLRMEEQLPSRDPAFLFRSTVTFSCQVAEPEVFALRGIHDMAGCLRPALVRVMRDVARRYDISDFNAAEAALNRALDEFPADPAVHLGEFLVELSAGDEAAARSSTDYYNASRDTRMEGDRRRTMSGVVAGGRDEMIAQWLATHGGDPSAILDAEAEAKAQETHNLLQAMSILASSGGDTEPFDTREERSRLLSRFLSEYNSPSSREGHHRSIRSRVAGSLSAGRSTDEREPDGGPAGDSARHHGDPAGDDRGDQQRMRGPHGGSGPRGEGGAKPVDPDRPAERMGAAPNPRGHADDGEQRAEKPSRVRGMRGQRRSRSLRDPDADADRRADERT